MIGLISGYRLSKNLLPQTDWFHKPKTNLEVNEWLFQLKQFHNLPHHR